MNNLPRELPPELADEVRERLRQRARDRQTDFHVFGYMSDEWLANELRMLMRQDLYHEAFCVAARDRIMRLSLEVEFLRAAEQAKAVQIPPLLNEIEQLRKLHRTQAETITQLMEDIDGLQESVPKYLPPEKLQALQGELNERAKTRLAKLATGPRCMFSAEGRRCTMIDGHEGAHELQPEPSTCGFNQQCANPVICQSNRFCTFPTRDEFGNPVPFNIDFIPLAPPRVEPEAPRPWIVRVFFKLYTWAKAE